MSFHRPTSRRHRTTVAALIASGVLAVAGTAVVAATTTAPAQAAATATATPKPKASDADRTRLGDALKKARALDGEARRKAVAAVRSDARDGEYGDAIEQRVQRRDDRRLVRAALPKALREDLAKLRKADADDQAGVRAELRRKALAGDYGKRAQAVARRQGA